MSVQDRGIYIKLDGLEEVKRSLRAIPDKLKKKGINKALKAAGTAIRNEAKKNAPLLKEKAPHRKRGTIKRRISLRTSKTAKQAGDLGVFIGVKPLTKAQIKKFKLKNKAAGAKNPDDPFYWWWVEFGHNVTPRRSTKFGNSVRMFVQVLRNGRKVIRRRSVSNAGIRVRRRESTTRIDGKYFLTRAARAKGGEAVKIFETEAGRVLRELNVPGGLT